MEKGLHSCCVCLSIDTNLRKITEIEQNGLTIMCKLQSCVTEIDWQDHFAICQLCNDDLDFVHAFKEKCVNSSRKLLQPPSPPPYSVKDESPSPPPKPKRRRNPPPEFACDICHETFKTSARYVSHVAEEHQLDPKTVRPFACPQCPKRFLCAANRTQHLTYHSSERPHVCSFCGKGFKTRNDLQLHERLHLNRREYGCERCPKRFNTHKDLRSHRLVVHTDPARWSLVCEVCSRRFPTKTNLEAHVRRHRGDRPFACHLCEKRFVVNSSLQRHFVAHSEHRAFVCEVCKRGYKHEGAMRVHMKRVHGVGDAKVPERAKRHLCHVCPKSFCDKSKLVKHMCSHTGEKPYTCTICQKGFVDKSYIKPHMKKMHNVGDTDD